MALMALFFFLSLSHNLHGVLAAPALYKISNVSMLTMSSGFEPISLSTPDAGSPPSFLAIPWASPHGEIQYAFSVAIPTATTTVTVNIAEKPTTVAPLPAATTATSYITIPILSQTPSLSSMSTFSMGTLGPAKDIWVEPTKMDNLNAFGITAFDGSGRSNLEIVSANTSADGFNATSDNSTSLQVLYPNGSIDPGRKPIGGVQFYASPLDISNAQNVTLRYSAFFPEDFDFVLAGKMPGLYGGRTGCSGGDAALDCFSTRLMWRTEGLGELYLYAPKNKQTKALCSAPGSFCDATYGLSVGRGSFKWATGDWTTVQQTVSMNTPGMQDGSFTLDVNGKRVISRDDIFYRDKLVDNGSDRDVPPATSTKAAKPTMISDPSNNDGGLLDGLLGGRGLPDPKSVSTLFTAPTTNESGSQPITTILPRHTVNDQIDASEKTIGFAGIFFSTFFGGHEERYATPRAQYTWFKDFALAYNS